jgi:arylsulfatase A-like enzyme
MKVIIIVADSLRGDAPGFAGGPAETPVLDRLAGEGAAFDRAFCSASWTIPSLACMDTGTPAHRHGVVNWSHALPADTPSLLGRAHTAGFDTRLCVPNPWWAFAGWPHRPDIVDSQDLDAVCAAIRGPRGADKLVMVHHWWTHFPYLCKALPWGGRQRATEAGVQALGRNPAALSPRFQRLYHAAVAHFSEVALPRMMEAALAGGDDVLLVVTADHGESWGELCPPGTRPEHVFDLHGRWLADATTHVPLVFWGRAAGGAVTPSRPTGFARGVDLAPTIADLAGLPWPAPASLEHGQSMRDSVLRGTSTGIDNALTIGSANCHVPDVYPTRGPELWRCWSRRTDDGRDTWDAFSGTPSPFTKMWASAVGPAGTVERPGSPPEAPKPDPNNLFKAMATLGYLD